MRNREFGVPAYEHPPAIVAVDTCLLMLQLMRR